MIRIMKRPVHAARLLNRRAVVVVGTLLVLCVSDGVGPRLLPLPTLARAASSAPETESGQAAPREVSRGATAARVAMINAPQIQAAKERPQQQAAAHTPETTLRPQTLTTAPSLSPPLVHESAGLFSRPRDRAPPRRP